MNMEDQVREAIVDELKRQAEIAEGGLKLTDDGNDLLTIQGRVNLDELAMAVVGAVAGGP
jgi:hypothetical protein